MTQTAINYAKVLYELGISKTMVEEAERIMSSVPELKGILTNPTVSKLKKHNIIEKVFPKEMHNFFKVLSDYQSIEETDDIFAAYKKYYNEKNGILEAKLSYVTAPGAEQLEGIRTFLMNKYHKKQVNLMLIEDSAILGGFIIQVDNNVTDWSIRGRFNQLQQKLVRR
jgi:F-type H+-transporting ATPase subunit delta